MNLLQRAPLDVDGIARAVMADVVSHFHDFKEALEKMKASAPATALDDAGPNDKSYWDHQLLVLERLKIQSEIVLNTGAEQETPRRQSPRP